MKKWWFTLLFAALTGTALADEGLWLPYFLGDALFQEMVKKGLKLTKDQIYHANKTSLKDQVLLINGRFNAAVVSKNGLLLTTDEAALRSLDPALSELLSGAPLGYFAADRSSEGPSTTLYADQWVKMEEVTAEVEDSLKALKGADRQSRLQTLRQIIAARFSDPGRGILASLGTFGGGTQFLVFVYRRYRDLRLVAASSPALNPRENNANPWQWPRTMAGFLLLRVYTNPSGNPSPYSKTNQPAAFPQALPISLKGFRESDITLVLGYPPFSSRYAPSMAIRLYQEVSGPARVQLSKMALEQLSNVMKSDPALSQQLQPAYASIQTTLQQDQGRLLAMSRDPVLEKRLTQETEFRQWAQSKAAYIYLFRDWEKSFAQWMPLAKQQVYLSEAIDLSPCMAFAASLQLLEDALVKQKGGNLPKILEQVQKARQAFLQNENKASDQRIVAEWTRLFYQEIPKNQHPIGFFETLKGSYGDLHDPNTFVKYAQRIFSQTIFFDDGRWNAFLQNPDAALLQDDPAYHQMNAFLRNWQSKYAVFQRQFETDQAEFERSYAQAVSEWSPLKRPYPDGNGSLRLSFGSVRSYSPGPSVHYDYLCTSATLLDQVQRGLWTTALPAELLDSLRKKTFGICLDKTKNDLVLTFVTNNDLGESQPGAPVLNANGQLLGLVLGPNAEALDLPFRFEPSLSRAMALDLRFVVWYLQKFSPPGLALTQELTLLKN